MTRAHRVIDEQLLRLHPHWQQLQTFRFHPSFCFVMHCVHMQVQYVSSRLVLILVVMHRSLMEKSPPFQICLCKRRELSFIPTAITQM